MNGWCGSGTATSPGMDTSSPALMFRQQRIFRAHAAGNFRQMLQEVTVDPAMLFWLNGAWSTADNPNENYARELMELFALGRNNGYTEDDVHQAAVALSGWWVDGDHDDRVEFDPERGPRHTVPLFGGRVGSAAEVIDAVCDHPACAPHIAGALYRALHGVDPADDVRAELAAVFADGGLQLRPLLEATVRHPTFLATRSRARRTWSSTSPVPVPAARRRGRLAAVLAGPDAVQPAERRRLAGQRPLAQRGRRADQGAVGVRPDVGCGPTRQRRRRG